MRTMLVMAALLSAGCSSIEGVESTAQAISQGEMIIYERGQVVSDDELTDLGPPGGLGGTVIDGDPKISARVDYAEGDRLAGVFQATRGTVLIHFPFTEHATIMNGAVALTDETGVRRVLRPGDSYLIHQGSDILWEVSGDRVQKSFFNRVEAADSPGPMIVYERGSVVADDELTDLGPPDGLGGTVIDGDPAISARVDYANAGLLGGVFQGTRGEVAIHFPFTEHATITKGKVALVDETGYAFTLHPGDSYLILQSSDILWDVNGARVQKSFFNFTAVP